MNTIYFGCTKLSSIAPWIQLRQERNCTHNPMLPLGSHVTASPGSDGRGQYRGWGQAISGADCGGVDWHKIGFYPCSCKSCMISCTATSLHEAKPNSNLPLQLPFVSNQTIYLGSKACI